jgi:hypothetical protein
MNIRDGINNLVQRTETEESVLVKLLEFIIGICSDVILPVIKGISYLFIYLFLDLKGEALFRSIQKFWKKFSFIVNILTFLFNLVFLIFNYYFNNIF